MAHVHQHDAVGLSRSRTRLEELACREVERDVGLAVGVDDDHVETAVRAAAATAGRRPRGRSGQGCACRTSGGRGESAQGRSRRRRRTLPGSSGRAPAPSCRPRCRGSRRCPAPVPSGGERQHERARPSSRRSATIPAGRRSAPRAPRSAPACAAVGSSTTRAYWYCDSTSSSTRSSVLALITPSGNSISPTMAAGPRRRRVNVARGRDRDQGACEPEREHPQ